jgi:SAM-dependent methyltransferase
LIENDLWQAGPGDGLLLDRSGVAAFCRQRRPFVTDAALNKVRASWEYFGTNDPLWGVYSRPSMRGGGWDPDAFFQTGREEMAELLGRVRQLLPEVPHDRAVDFGCGVGRLTQPLSEHFDRVTGVDISEPMLAKARQFNRRSNIEWLLNTRPDLALLPDGTTDFVLAHIVFQHMPPPLTFGYLAEMQRVLRSGGGLVFTQPSMPDPTRLGGLAYAVLPQQLLFRLRKLRDKAVMEMHPIRHDVMIKHLTDLGLEVVFLEPSTSASRNWVGFRYFVRKP